VSAMLALLVLDRPWALWALLLPPIYLWWVVLARRPRSIVVGTLALWRDMPRVIVHDGARRRGRPPPAALAIAVALGLAALAGSAPRPGVPAPVREWTCLLDTSASMGLVLEGTTRGEHALDAALGWLREHAGADDKVLWRTPGREPLRLSRDARPPLTWTSPRRGTGGEPDWAREDGDGVLWITDHEPAVLRERAGLFISGGPAVPGPVAADGRRVVRWDGEHLVEEPATRTPLLYLRAPRGSRVPAVIERLVEAWCQARGFARVDASSGNTDLVVELLPGPGGSAVELARDGWRALARLARDRASADADAVAAQVWLETRVEGSSVPVVTRAPGRVTIDLAELDEPLGDPVLFALSWGRLLDACALPPEGVVALEERIEAGVARVVAPRQPEASGVAPIDRRLEAGLALAAALLGALGSLGARRPA
jgi:hypothetical protein